MTKVCYLHLGLHKTASTSIQATFAQNACLLQERGITYPVFSLPEAKMPKIINHSIPVYSLYCERPEKYHVNRRWGVQNNIEKVNSAYEEQLASYLSTSGDIFISGEDVSVLPMKSLSRLICTIQSYDYQIKAIALVRDPYSMFCSEMAQYVRGGRHFPLLSFNDCIPSSFNTAEFSRFDVLEKLKTVFGDSMYLYDFDRARAHSSGPVGFLIEEFMDQDPLDIKYVYQYKSLCNLSIRIQNEFNAINPSFVDGSLNLDFKSFPELVDERLKFSGKFLLTNIEYSLIENYVKDEVSALSKFAGLRFEEKILKFTNPIF